MKRIQRITGNKFCRLGLAACVWGVVLLTASAGFRPTLSRSAPAVEDYAAPRSIILPPPSITVFSTWTGREASQVEFLLPPPSITILPTESYGLGVDQ
jgi:hypothetical protein